MEVLAEVDSLLVVYRPVLGKRRHVGVVQDSWNDRLSEHSLSSVVDDSRGNEVKAVNL